MKFLVVSLGILLALRGTGEKEFNEVLRSYIQWTTTGKSEHVFFDEHAILIYHGVQGNENTLFQDYKVKIENAASSIPREMNIKSIKLIGDIAKAEITDCSEDHLFLLVHYVILRNTNNQWKIESIEIEAKN